METASNLPETELTLECPQCAFDARSVLPAVPGHPGLRMHAVDHDVHVRVVPVLMRDHERLVFGEPEVRQDTVRHGLHPLRCDRVCWVEIEREMVDRALNARVLVGDGLHEHRSEVRIVEAEVPASGPGDALCFFSGAA